MSDIQQPIIPQVGTGVDSNVRRGFDSIRGYFDRVFKKEGGIVTNQDLVNAGVLDANGNPTILTINTAIPPKITGFVATGAFRTIVLTWDDMNYRYLAFYEIWRSETESMTNAIRIGTTSAAVYSDAPPVASTTKTYWYWVRMVSTGKRQGPWSESAAGSTANDPAYLLQVLSENVSAANFALNLTGSKPFFVLTEDATVGGVVVPAGMYVNDAYITNLTSTNIKAGGIAADRLDVTNLAAISADLGAVTAGSLNLGSGKFVVDTSGNVTIVSAITGGRMEMRNNSIKVYDASNILRVRIGDFSV